jgi:hypothetical protein
MAELAELRTQLVDLLDRSWLDPAVDGGDGRLDVAEVLVWSIPPARRGGGAGILPRTQDDHKELSEVVAILGDETAFLGTASRGRVCQLMVLHLIVSGRCHRLSRRCGE